MAFSGAVTLTDLNDFIIPSQACIKPVEQTISKSSIEKGPGGATTEIRIDSKGSYYEVSANGLSSLNNPASDSENKLEQAQISLNDCLACSGCITSAESVLISIQSHTEVLNFLESNALVQPLEARRIPIMSIAPQSLASLAASLSFSSKTVVTPRQILRRLRTFSKEKLGFAHIFDTTFARHVALDEHVKEFIERRDKHRAGTALPMLASACPGWICYAEKTHHAILPFISNTKSPQQVMGTLVKNWIGSKLGKLPDEIYHVSVMPCYDKKLEASRSDFYNELYSTRDVDCVITTGEMQVLMRDKSWDLSRPVPGELDELAPCLSDLISDSSLPELISHPGSSSGSYLHSIISHLQGTSNLPLTLSVRQIRNADYEEYVLREEVEEGEGEVIFKGAKCFGFQNLQNVVRKVGRETGIRTTTGAAGRLAGRAFGVANRRGRKGGGSGGPEKGYDYVEVMACPGGCVNGGGQLKPPTSVKDEEGLVRNWDDSGALVGDEGSRPEAPVKLGNKEWTKKVEEAYWQDYRPGSGFDDVPVTKQNAGKGDEMVADRLLEGILNELCPTDEGLGDLDVQKEQLERSRRRLFRTEYRAVESEVIGLAVKW